MVGGGGKAGPGERIGSMMRAQTRRPRRHAPEQLEDGEHTRAIRAVQLRARDDDGPGEARNGRRLVGADTDHGHGHGGHCTGHGRCLHAKRKTLRGVAWHGVAGVPSTAAPRRIAPRSRTLTQERARPPHEQQTKKGNRKRCDRKKGKEGDSLDTHPVAPAIHAHREYHIRVLLHERVRRRPIEHVAEEKDL